MDETMRRSVNWANIKFCAKWVRRLLHLMPLRVYVRADYIDFSKRPITRTHSTARWFTYLQTNHCQLMRISKQRDERNIHWWWQIANRILLSSEAFEAFKVSSKNWRVLLLYLMMMQSSFPGCFHNSILILSHKFVFFVEVNRFYFDDCGGCAKALEKAISGSTWRYLWACGLVEYPLDI